MVIFGNSGSGKSTLARQLAEEEALAHLDLDTLAWEPTMPPQRKSLTESGKAIADFMVVHDAWVIEGCYANRIELVLPRVTEIIFLDLSVEDCISVSPTGS